MNIRMEEYLASIWRPMASSLIAIVASWHCGVGWWNKLIFTSTLVEQTNIHLDSGWIFGESVASYEKLMSCHGGIMASWRQLVEQINIHIDSGLSKITARSSSSGN